MRQLAIETTSEKSAATDPIGLEARRVNFLTMYMDIVYVDGCMVIKLISTRVLEYSTIDAANRPGPVRQRLAIAHRTEPKVGT